MCVFPSYLKFALGVRFPCLTCTYRLHAFSSDGANFNLLFLVPLPTQGLFFIFLAYLRQSPLLWHGSEITWQTISQCLWALRSGIPFLTAPSSPPSAAAGGCEGARLRQGGGGGVGGEAGGGEDGGEEMGEANGKKIPGADLGE